MAKREERKGGNARERRDTSPTTDRFVPKVAAAKLDSGRLDYKAVTTEPAAAQRFVRQLLQTAAAAAPDHEWTEQDLRDVLEFVVRAGPPPVQVMEGRHLRKRIREQLARSERYHEPFSVMVVTLGDAHSVEMYSPVLDSLLERLRKTDMVFMYKKRFAILLPHTQPASVQMLSERLRSLIAAVIGRGSDKALTMQTSSYPSRAHVDDESILDWCEDQLRE